MSIKMAVGVGFEPTEDHSSTVFKTAAFDRSASPPNFMTSVLDRTFWKLRPTLVVSHHSIVCLSRPIHWEVRE